MKAVGSDECIANLKSEVLAAVGCRGWKATTGVIRELGHPDPEVLGRVVGKLLSDYRLGWAQGDLEEFPNEIWMLASLSDDDWKTLKAGGEAGGGMRQGAFTRRAYRSKVKDSEIRYMRAFRVAVAKITAGALFVPGERSKLQLLRGLSAADRDDRRRRAGLQAREETP